MRLEEIEVRWRELAEEVVTGMKQWRLEHSKATFKEIEDALDDRLAKLRAQMLEDAALASSVADVTALSAQERPRCPECGEVLESRGQEKRSLRTNHNETITLTRSYTICPSCGTDLFPPR